MTVDYPEDFAEKVKRLCPDDIQIQKALDAGWYMLGKMIFDKALDVPKQDRADLLGLGKEWLDIPSVRNASASIIAGGVL